MTDRSTSSASFCPSENASSCILQTSSPLRAQPIPPQVLRQLQCPLLANCVRQASSDGCPFDHQPTATESSPTQAAPQLFPIPDGICEQYLLGHCQLELFSCSEIVQGTVLICANGMHPILQQLPQDLNRVKMFNEKDIKDPSPLNDSWQKVLTCKLCRKCIGGHDLAPFGMLEHCTDPFCSRCIAEYRSSDKGDKCAVCAVHSDRVLIWPNFITYQPVKAHILDSFDRMHKQEEDGDLAGHSVEQDNSAQVFESLPDHVMVFVLLAFNAILLVLYFD